MTDPTPSLRGAKRRCNPASLNTPKTLILLAALLITCIAASILLPHSIATTLTTTTQKLRALGAFGWLIFIILETLIALIGILPASLLGIAAGAVYGIAAGFFTSAIGILAGALIAFGLSRSYARPLIAGLLGRRKKLAAFDAALTTQSWRMVALLRISPVMPFSLTSYALGLSGITRTDYIIGTLACLPALAGYVTIGALGGSTLSSHGDLHILILSLGAAATLALTIQLSRATAKALKNPV